MMIPTVAIYKIIVTPGTFVQVCDKDIFQPSTTNKQKVEIFFPAIKIRTVRDLGLNNKQNFESEIFIIGSRGLKLKIELFACITPWVTGACVQKNNIYKLK